VVKQVVATFVTWTPPHTALETGSRTISGGASGDQWSYLPDVHIPFSTPFSSQPAVRLAIGGVEDDSRVPGSFYGAYAVNVTTTGFDLSVRYAYSNSFRGRVNWIATGEKPVAEPPQLVRAGRITVTPAASTGDSWQLVSRTHISFDGPFSSAPSVWLALRGIDDRLNRNGTYYELQAAAITGSGFDLEVYGNHAAVFSAAWIDWIAVGATSTPAEPPSVQSGEHSMSAAVRPAASRWSEVYKAHIDFDRPFAVPPAVAVNGRLTDHVTGRQNGNFRYIEPSNITTTGFDLVVYAADSDSYNMDRFDWIAVEGVAHQKTMPLFAVGAFAASRDAPEAAAHEGNVVLVVPSYAEDAEAVALALEASDKQAILSAHHVFGGPRDQWEDGWAQTLQWAAPLRSRGLVAAIYVVDEPLANGIPAAERDEAIAIVRTAGYKTMIAEYIGNARNDVTGPQQVDYYGVTAYDPPLSLEQALTEYRNHPQWNFVVGQGFDLQSANGTPQQQFAAWIDVARDTRRAGVVFWVWRWPNQTGIADDPEYLAAYDDQVRARPMPGFAAGAFTPSIDVPEAAAHGGNLVLVVPSYRDDPEAVALALEAGNKRAVLSAHHVFGGPPDQWQAGWAQTLRWAAPLTSRGLVAAIYVVDEPLHNGIPVAQRDEAIAIVRASGYKTMIAEWIDSARNDTTGPQRVDYYGVSAYDFGFFGPTLQQALAEYANHPQWNFVVGQGFDLQSRNGSPQQQFTAWVDFARNTRRAGVVFWVWRWSQQTGIGDNAEYLAAYDAAMK